VTRGRLPQRAGLPGLNGGGAAAAVPPKELKQYLHHTVYTMIRYVNTAVNNKTATQ